LQKKRTDFPVLYPHKKGVTVGRKGGPGGQQAIERLRGFLTASGKRSSSNGGGRGARGIEIGRELKALDRRERFE